MHSRFSCARKIPDPCPFSWRGQLVTRSTLLRFLDNKLAVQQLQVVPCHPRNDLLEIHCRLPAER